MGLKTVDISDETYLRLERLKRPGESFSDVVERIGSHSKSHLTSLQRFGVVVWGYCFAVWLYVIAFQLRYPFSAYVNLAWWLPIRMDYLGEVAFVLSFIFALIVALYSGAKR